MTASSTQLENYEEFLRQVGAGHMQVIVYSVGEMHVCIINNLDPGATICRVSGPSRLRVLRLGLAKAKALLPQAVIEKEPEALAGGKVAFIEYHEGPRSACYSLDSFLNLPVVARVSYLTNNKVTFLDRERCLVGPGSALEYISKACRERLEAVAS